MGQRQFLFPILQVFLDGAAVLAAGLLAYWLRFTPLVSQVLPLDVDLSLNRFLFLLAPVVLAQLVIFAALGLYRLERPLSFGRKFGLIFSGALLTLAALAVWTTLTRQFFESRFILLIGWLLVIILVNFSHSVLDSLEQFLRGKFGFGLNKVFLIGRNNPGRNLELSGLFSRPFLSDFKVIGQAQQIDLSVLQKLKKQGALDEVLLTDLNYPRADLRQLINWSQQQGVGLKLASGVLEGFRTEARMLGGFLPVLEIKNTPLEGWGWVAKRGLDLVLSGLFFVAGLPLSLLVALAIKWDSRGPVIVRLRRAGRQGRPFYMYKFRSMVDDAHQFKSALQPYSERPAPFFKMKNDPRITRVGRFLRRFRVDELPQIINVLKGEMSLVGPRPHEVGEIREFQDWQKRTLSIPPGVTGLGQISGSAQLPPWREAELDIYYLENWSLGLDISIILRTVLRVFKDPGAY